MTSQGRVGVSAEIIEIDLAGTQQFMDERADEQAVGAGPNADPLIGDRRIAGADGIDRDDAWRRAP